MKEIVLVTLAIDTETGEIEPKAPFMVNSRRHRPRYTSSPPSISGLRLRSGPGWFNLYIDQSGFIVIKAPYRTHLGVPFGAH